MEKDELKEKQKKLLETTLKDALKLREDIKRLNKLGIDIYCASVSNFNYLNSFQCESSIYDIGELLGEEVKLNYYNGELHSFEVSSNNLTFIEVIRDTNN